MSIQTLSELFLEILGCDEPDCPQGKTQCRFRPLTTEELNPTQKVERRVLRPRPVMWW